MEIVCGCSGEERVRIYHVPESDNPRSMLLMCYQNSELPVKIPKGALQSGSPVMAAFCAAKKAGVEFWQV